MINERERDNAELDSGRGKEIILIMTLEGERENAEHD
jgi:hypothetical protein